MVHDRLTLRHSCRVPARPGLLPVTETVSGTTFFPNVKLCLTLGACCKVSTFQNSQGEKGLGRGTWALSWNTNHKYQAAT